MNNFRSENNECILIVDDQSSIRISLRNFLEDYGYQVLTAENGKVGLNVCHENNPDLVILDMKMPVMGGKEVLEILNKESPDTPVIVVSGTGLIEDCISALQHGAEDFILKPIINMSIFLHQIQKVLFNARLKRENRSYQVNLEKTYRQLKVDEEMGKKIQRRLLPEENINIKDYFLSYFFMPSKCLSGDFVDYINIQNKYIVMYSADVSGHGISSALVTVLLKGFMKMHLENYKRRSIETILEPDKLLNSLNKELIEENLDKFITMFYGVINIETSVLKYCYAGQYPYPVIWHEDRCNLITGKGYPVGLFPQADYNTRYLELGKKFKMAIFSDGIIDILEQNSNHAKIEFLKTLESDELLNNLVNQLKKKNPFPDDITILTISKGHSNG